MSLWCHFRPSSQALSLASSCHHRGADADKIHQTAANCQGVTWDHEASDMTVSGRLPGSVQEVGKVP